MENLFTITNITLFIALWGAILLTIKVLSDYRVNTRKLEVKILNSFISQGNITRPLMLSIDAINSGSAFDSIQLHQREKGHHIETLGVHFFWQSKTKLKRRKVMFGV